MYLSAFLLEFFFNGLTYTLPKVKLLNLDKEKVMSFEVGNVVRLKSGSPAMTVAVVHDGGETVYVRWFDEASNDVKGNVVEVHCLDLDE